MNNKKSPQHSDAKLRLGTFATVCVCVFCVKMMMKYKRTEHNLLFNNNPGGGPGQYQDQSQGVEQEHLRLGQGRGGRGPHQLRLPPGPLLLHQRGGHTEVPGQSCLEFNTESVRLTD